MKYAVVYIIGNETRYGVHGFGFDTLPGCRFARVPHLVTPEGYKEKLSGQQLKDERFNPEYKYPDGVCRPKDPIVKPEGSQLWYIDIWDTEKTPDDLKSDLESLGVEYLHVIVVEDKSVINFTSKPEIPNVIVTKCNASRVLDKNGIWTGRWQGADKDYAGYANRNYVLAGRGFFITPNESGEYWEADKSVPPELIHKWSYTLTSDVEPTYKASNGETYYEYFLGCHAKSNDELEVLGKEDPETGFAVVLMKERCAAISDIAKYHAKHLWDGARRFERYDVMGMVNINNLMKPKTQFEVRNFGNSVFPFSDHNCRMLNGQNELISLCLVPPRISYRVLDIRDDLRNVLDSCINKGMYSELYFTDVTELFIVGGKLNPNFGTTVDMIEVEVNNHVGDKRKLQLIRGLDFPLRSTFSGIVNTVKSIRIVTWPFSHKVYRYAMVIETEDSFSIWSAGYSGLMFCL